MRPYEIAAQASELAERIEAEVLLLKRSEQAALVRLLAPICAELSLYSYAIMQQDEALAQRARFALLAHKSAVMASKTALLRWKTYPALSYQNIVDVIDRLVVPSRTAA